MPELVVDIGGRPGVDCRGFCEYCYFRHVKATEPFGCRYCPPFRVGCDYCTRSVKEQYSGFKEIREVSYDVIASLDRMNGELEKVTISGGGDPSCYPAFRPLVESLAAMEAPLHIGYTSGKGFDDPDIARFLIDNGLAEVSFTVFSVDPRKRRKYMHDPTPEVSLAVLERLCGECESTRLPSFCPCERRPILEATCTWLEEAVPRADPDSVCKREEQG